MLDVYACVRVVHYVLSGRAWHRWAFRRNGCSGKRSSLLLNGSAKTVSFLRFPPLTPCHQPCIGLHTKKHQFYPHARKHTHTFSVQCRGKNLCENESSPKSRMTIVCLWFVVELIFFSWRQKKHDTWHKCQIVDEIIFLN